MTTSDLHDSQEHPRDQVMLLEESRCSTNEAPWPTGHATALPEREAHFLRHTLRVCPSSKGLPLIFCSTCGAYASARPRELMGRCRGPQRSLNMQRALDSIASGKHPQYKYRDDVQLGPATTPSPSQLAWLVARMDTKAASARAARPRDPGSPPPAPGSRHALAARSAAEAYGGLQLLDLWAQESPGRRGPLVVDECGLEDPYWFEDFPDL